LLSGGHRIVVIAMGLQVHRMSHLTAFVDRAIEAWAHGRRSLDPLAEQRYLGWLACAVALAACGTDTALAPSQDELGAPITASESRFDPLIAAVHADLASSGASGIAVAVIEHGKLGFSRGFGTKAPGRGDPVDARTLFRIGSVTKMMTATAVLQQVASGKVELSAPVTRYVPDFHFDRDPSWAPSITIQELLTHTSGMFDFLVAGVPADQQADAALRSFVTTEFGADDYLMVPAGTFWNYSNPNFYVAGLVAEQTAGLPYRVLMKRRTFDPLRMTRTLFLGSEVLADGDYALGTNLVDPTLPALIMPDTYDNAWARPAGYAWSNVEDLARFAEFLMNGNSAVLPPGLHRAMQAPQVNTELEADLLQYGYGLVVQQGFFVGSAFYRAKLVWHNGDIPGFSALMAYVPSLQFGFIALANIDNVGFDASLAAALQTLARLPAPVAPPDLSIDPSSFGTYAGVYHDPFLVGDITVTVSGNDLAVDIPVLTQLGLGYDRVLVPSAPDNFSLTLRDPSTGAITSQLPVTFLPDDTGQIRYFRTREAVGIRSAAVALQRPLPSLTAAEREARLRALLRSQEPPPFGLLAPPKLE
jgi:CubicO group peptidase (beta-lactamase class C family)